MRYSSLSYSEISSNLERRTIREEEKKREKRDF
jgi:hypothetical protein